MKTFVTDDFHVTLKDNGGVKVLIEGYTTNISIIYDPDAEKPWSMHMLSYTEEANNITDLELGKSALETLRKALEVVGKQDLFDKEIVFIDKEDKEEK